MIAGQPLRSFERAQQWLGDKQQKLVFGMNGGMYHGDMSPVGLCVQNGHELAPLNLAKAEGNFFLKPNGIFLISDQRCAGYCVGGVSAALKEKVALSHPIRPAIAAEWQDASGFQGRIKRMCCIAML